MHNHIPKEVVEEYRESLKSEYASRQFHLKYPDFCEKTMDYFERMGKFAENAATKEDLTLIVAKIDDHESRISEMEGLKGDMKNILEMAASFTRWKDKALKLFAAGFFLMILKSIGLPDWFIKMLITMGGA